VNTLFEYIATILAIGLIISLVAYFRKRSENIRLKQDLALMEREIRILKRKLQAISENISLNNSVFEGNLDLQILELYTKGYSYGMIAKQLGISKSTVYRRLKKILEQKREKVPISI